MELISQSRLPIAYALRQPLVCLAVVKKPCCSQNVSQKLRCLDIKQLVFCFILSTRHSARVQGVFRFAFFAGFPIPVFATHVVLHFKVRSNPSINADGFQPPVISALGVKSGQLVDHLSALVKTGVHMKDILYFESMLTPKIITFVYWLLLLFALVSGLGYDVRRIWRRVF
jgi:hypothetical protein